MESDSTTWAGAERILCIRLDAMGDLIMTGPAIRAIKGSAAGPHITLLTSPDGAVVAPLLPGIDDVIIYDSPWMKSTAPRTSSEHDLKMIAQLAHREFQAAVIFTVFSQNPLPAALLCFLADIPLRSAYCRENPYQLLTPWVRETEPESGIKHEVLRQLELVRHLGFESRDDRLRLDIPMQARIQVANRLTSLGLPPGRWVAVHPGASAPSRRYPASLYAHVAHELAREGFGIVFTGSAGEVPLVKSIVQDAGVPAVSLAGKLSLEELAALYEVAPIVLANNTGPAHVAAAVGAPIVDLYALTNPQHTPWGVPSRVLSHDVPCRNCFKSICPFGHNSCLSGIEPDRVVAAVLDLYREVNKELRDLYVHTGYQCSVS